MVKIKRKLIRKNSEKPVASSKSGGMMGGLQVGPVTDPSLRLAYVEQIKRDTAVLREDPIYCIAPGRRFYEERIKMFRESLLGTSPSVGASGGPTATTIRPTPRVWVRLRRKKV